MGRMAGMGGSDRPTWIARRGSDLVDECPLDMIFAELIGASGPYPRADRVEQCGATAHSRVPTVRDLEDAARLFALGVDEVRVAIEADERRDVGVRPVSEN